MGGGRGWFSARVKKRGQDLAVHVLHNVLLECFDIDFFSI